MKKLILFLTVLRLLTSTRMAAQCSASITLLGSPTGCGNRTLTANPVGDIWTQKAGMISNRTAAAGFSIGNKGYIGTGATTSSNYNNDFWEYDQATNAWTQRANFPGTARQAAVGFSIGNKGYIGTGVDLNNTRKNDFYEYDPATNTWIVRASITGSRSYAVGFAIGSKGYVGTGYVSTSYVNDFYEFDPVSNTWTAKANFGGAGRHSATGFSIGSKGYVGFGSTGTAGTGDFWEYDPATNLWSQKAGIYGMQMFAASSFTLGNKGYMVGGKDQGTTNAYSSNTYQYDPATNLWRLMAANNANAKNYAVAFSIGGRGYVGTGSSGNSISAATNVLYEYEPRASYVWSNGATTPSVSVGGTASYSVLMTTASGCTASASQTIALAPNPTLSVSGGSLVCSATTSTLSASGASSYTWSANAGGGNSPQTVVTPSISTTYTVSGTTGSCTVGYPVSVLVSGAPIAGISVSGPTLGCGVRTLSVNPGGDTWTQKASMSLGHERAIGFSIGSKGYLGTGTDGGSSKDFWEYDPVTDVWTQKADFGGGNRFHAYNFAIGGKGYAGGGYSNLSLYGFAMDFWEYDPITNAWTRKGDVPMTPRFVAVSFAIGNKGYMGTGQDNYGNFAFNDFWEYDPATDLWTQKANVPTAGRAGAAVFSIGNKGYLGSGYPAYPSTTPFLDFWEFDPAANTWAAIAPFPGGAGGNGVGFAIGNKGYVTNGSYTLNPSGLWEYSPATNTWTPRTDFPGTPRPWSVAFVIGNKGYMGSGPISSTLNSYKDLWAYEPGASFVWSTGATSPSITASVSGSYSVTIHTVTGCSVTSAQSLSLSPNPTITVGGNPNYLCAGLSATLNAGGGTSYTWSGNAGGGTSSSVIITPTASGSYTVSGTNGTCTVNQPFQIHTLPPPSSLIATSGPTLGCGTLTLSVDAPPLGWTQKASLNIMRRQGISFSIGSKGYVGLGQSNTTPLSDLWEYDPQTNVWTQKAGFTPGPRYEATGFSIDTKGYVACGYDNTSALKNDLWEFDPLANTWTQKLSLGAARAGATGFGLNGKGYVGLGDGSSGSLRDFWEYDPAGNTWTQKADYSGGARAYPASFTIGSKGYVGTGYSISGTTSDFWEFDPVANTWTAKAAYGGGTIYNTKGFSLNNKGYFTAGNGSSLTNAMWEYDPVPDIWTQKPGLSGGARTEHVCFAIGNKGYAGMGFNVTAAPYYFSDLWEFDPGTTIAWSTGSTLQAIAAATSGNYSVNLINSYGCSAVSSQSVALSPNPTITVSGIPTVLCSGLNTTLTASGAGSYTWSSNAGGGNNASVTVSPSLSTSYTVSGTTGSCTVDFPVSIFVSTTPVATIATSGPTLNCGSLNLSVNTPSSHWTQKASLTVARSQGVAFSVGNKGYIGLGTNGSPLADFWEYDPATNAWTQKANFSGGARTGATGFGIGLKGYVAAGYVASGNQYKNDLWEFDPMANTWVQKTSFTSFGRQYCTGFSLNGKGYVGLGTNSSGSALGDFWEYTPASDTWVQKASFIGPRTKAVSFTIGSLAYVGTGMSNTALVPDLWAFDPVADTWTARAGFAGTPVQLASAFSLGNKGYIGLGSTGVNDLNAFWEYNASTNTWTQKGNFSGAARQAAGTFAIGDKAYVATGYNGFNAPNYKNDLWEYQQITSINWSTGSTLQTIAVSASGNYSVTLTNTEGCSASSSQSVALSPNPTISVSGYNNLLCSGNSVTLSVSGAGTHTWSGNAGGGNTPSVIVTPSASTFYTVSGTTGSCTIDYPVYVDVMSPPPASIIPIGSTTICGAAITLSTNAGVSNIWAQRTSITTARNYAAGFSVNGKGYVGTGLSGTNGLSDFWEYDPATNTWSQKASFGGGARWGAVGMSIGNKGYIGTGFDMIAGLHKNDFWEYDPAANTWTQKANFGGAVRRQAAGFSIDNKGYVGTGWDGASYKNDLWEYDPAANLWTQKANITGGHRYSAMGVSLGNKGYIGGGMLLSSSGTNEFWEYDPAVNSWTQRANIGPSGTRVGAVSFALGDRIIVSGGNTLNTTYEYNPSLDTWVLRTAFAGPYRSNSVAFAINGKGYVAAGSGASVYADFWEYSPITNILWSNSAVTPSISVISTGTYSLVHTNIAGCASSATQAVNITPIPTVSISGPGAVCHGSTLSLTASGASSYTWSANAGNATTHTVDISPSTNTSYVVTGAANGCTASATKEVTVNAIPLVTAHSSTTTVCQGFNITLNGAGATTYTWTGGAIDNTPFVPGATADYTVTGSANDCTNTAVISVTVNPSPTVTVNSGSVCAGTSFTLNPGGAVNYTYSGGSNVVTPGVTTSYSVTGINAIGCTNAIPAISTVTVNALPLITVSDGSICAGSSYTITPGGAASYTYSSGSDVVTPANTATYGVTGTSTAGCVSSAQTVLTVTVISLPLVSVSDGTICNGQSFTLNPGGADTYTFLPGGSAIVTPTANTTYTITGANLFGCISAAPVTANIHVLVSPTVSVNSGSICAGQSFTLNPGGAVSYTYSGGSGIVSPGSTSIYTVTGFNANGCTNAVPATATVIVHPLPLISANSGVLCAGDAYTIIPTGASSYTYSSGSNIVTPALTSTYAISGSSSEGCVSLASATITVTVSPLPVVSVNSGSICSGSDFTLTPSGALHYTYLPGNSAIVKPNTSTSYSVTGANADGCVSALPAISSVTVYATPLVSVNSGSICEGASFTLNPAGATSYTYSGGSPIVSPNTTTDYSVTGVSAEGCLNTTPAIATVTVYASAVISASSGTICTGQNFTMSPSGAFTYTYSGGSDIVSPTALTTYTIYGTSAEGCPAKEAFVTVSVQPSLTLSIAGPTVVCEGKSIVLTASGANTYTWNTGANSSSIAPGPVSGTVYLVNATSGACTASASQVVSVLPSPALSIVYSNPVLCTGDTATIMASGADLYSWDDGSTLPVIVINPSVTTSYTLTGMNLNGCNSVSVITQQVSDCTGIPQPVSTEVSIRVFPNPNQGHVTITSSLFPENARLELYNYLGQLIYSESIAGTEAHLNFEDAARGMYTLRVSAQGKPIFITKLIRQ
jgi:N-acetylneuraminic acid mutarotase